MKSRWTVGSLSLACLLLPSLAGGQQAFSPSQWQGVKQDPLSLQSQENYPATQLPLPAKAQPSGLDDRQPVPKNHQYPTPNKKQPLGSLGQPADRPNTQEIPSVWPQEQRTPSVIQAVIQSEPQPLPPSPAPVNLPGYLGLGVRNFYRERFCMHALTIQGVEAVTVAPDSPAAQAGFRPARSLSPREVATATVAGLLTLSPVASLAPSVVHAAGGVNHGDIILAVNGKRVKTQEEFQREMLSYPPHTTVYFTTRRGEEVMQIPARLDAWPTSTTVASFQ